jgi:hypothetical protein
VFRQSEMREGEDVVQPGESVPAIPPVDINTRAANRQTVELVLDGAVQFGIVHILAHGATSVPDSGGERMSEAEIVSLISSQKALQFVFLACCNGYKAAGGIHNALHVPVVAYNAPIEDRAAVEFVRGFYRSWRRERDVGTGGGSGARGAGDAVSDRGRQGATWQRGHGDALRVRGLDGEDRCADGRHGCAVGRDQSAVGPDGCLSAALVVGRAAAGSPADRGAGGAAIFERGSDPYWAVVHRLLQAIAA